MNRYDGLSYKGHANAVRNLIPWRWSSAAALLPLLALAPPPSGLSSTAGEIVWLLLGLAACEIYSVCFHRESYIAAFEPWCIPSHAAPLGAPPERASDRRLHRLVRVQCLYVVPLLATASLVDLTNLWVSWVLCFAFIVKFVTPAWIDYEAYFHWDMHCGVLAMRDAPRLTRVWRGVCEWVLGPAVGSLPHLYSTEHLVIHHPANAGPKDIHSPLPYWRTSVMEFAHYALKTVLVIATSIGVVQHPRCSPTDRVRLIAGAVAVWGIAVLGVVNQHPVGYWLIAALCFRGTNTAIAQYVWHGLHDGTGSSSPLSSTILWLPVRPPAPIRGDGGSTSSPTSSVEPIHPLEGLVDTIPHPGTDWAFFDNYHLVHHLHPRAHFTEYPRLLESDLARIASSDSPILTLDVYSTFFSDLMARQLDRISSSFMSSRSQDENAETLRNRLMPWQEARSAISLVTESPVGSRLDAGFSRAWSHVRKIAN